MSEGNFLCPHLDNSHDRLKERYLAINALFYVSPKWESRDGGSLQLWGEAGQLLRSIDCHPNRLVLMATDDKSWHSVSKVHTKQDRCCISSYYFSRTSPTGYPFDHVTTFRGFPGEYVKDILLRTDSKVRNVLKALPLRSRFDVKHMYKKDRSR